MNPVRHIVDIESDVFGYGTKTTTVKIDHGKAHSREGAPWQALELIWIPKTAFE